MNQEIDHFDLRLVDLEHLLARLAGYGKPRISRLGSGWHCRVEMAVISEGTTFEIRSDFGLPTPRAAAVQCYERVLDAVPSSTWSTTP